MRFAVVEGIVPARADRFRELFDECYQPLSAYARRRVGPDDADDLVADVLTVAWRRLDDVPADAALPWLYGVARGLLRNRRRGRARGIRLVTRLAAQRPLDSTPPEHSAVIEALARLPETDQEVLRLAAWEQLRPAEIALVMGCSANAAALRLSRARARLRRSMTELAASRTEGV